MSTFDLHLFTIEKPSENIINGGIFRSWCFLYFVYVFFFCHKLYEAKEKKLFKLSWRGNPREASRLIMNGLPQLNNLR